MSRLRCLAPSWAGETLGNELRFGIERPQPFARAVGVIGAASS